MTTKSRRKSKVQATHTLGPWRVSELSDRIFGADGFEVCDPSQGPHTSQTWEKDIQEEYRHWADGKGTDYIDRADEEIAANARLIAAAPELLEACRLARRGFWHIPIPSDEESKAYRELSEAHGKLVAAIQKATGMNQ